MGESAHVKVNKGSISYDWLTCIELRLIYLHTDSGIESVGTPNELALLAVISQQFKHGTSKPCWTWVLHSKLWCGVQAQRPWFHYPWRWLSLSWLQAQTLVFLEFRITNKGRLDIWALPLQVHVATHQNLSTYSSSLFTIHQKGFFCCCKRYIFKQEHITKITPISM